MFLLISINFEHFFFCHVDDFCGFSSNPENPYGHVGGFRLYFTHPENPHGGVEIPHAHVDLLQNS